MCLEDQAKACSPTDQPVRKFEDGLGINMTMKTFFYFPDRVIFWYPYSSTSMEWGLRRVVPAAAVTTHAKPHAQQQLARDLEVERSAVGLKVSARCSEAIRSHVDGWISCELQLCCCTATKKAESEPAISLSGNLKMVWVLI